MAILKANQPWRHYVANKMDGDINGNQPGYLCPGIKSKENRALAPLYFIIIARQKKRLFPVFNPRVRNYIQEQEQHHRDRPFIEEYAVLVKEWLCS